VQLTCQNVMLCLQNFGGGGEGAAYLPKRYAVSADLRGWR